MTVKVVIVDAGQSKFFLIIEAPYLRISGRGQRRQIVLTPTQIHMVVFDSPVVGRIQLDVQLVTGIPDAAGSDIDMVIACQDTQPNSPGPVYPSPVASTLGTALNTMAVAKGNAEISIFASVFFIFGSFTFFS